MSRADRNTGRLLAAALIVAAAACSVDSPAAPADAPDTAATPATIALPGGAGGVGFDELRYARALGKLLVPAGRTGSLDLVDPATGAVEAIAGFAESSPGRSGHGEGTTSADEGAGLLFAIDRTRTTVDVIDPAARAIVGSAGLAAEPDYVRFVASRRELWVTEPGAEQIEIFALPEGARPAPEKRGVIAVAGGPESLVIDARRGRAYTHLWKGGTVAIDLATRAIVATWSNGCEGSRGIALDEARGWLFTGCREGRATVLDVEHDGRLLSSAPTGAGVDIIDYDAGRGHLYVPASQSATLTILGVSAAGELSVLGTAQVAKGAQGVATDGAGRVFVGDPLAGQLVVVVDRHPASGR
jgi:hypothetical protein